MLIFGSKVATRITFGGLMIAVLGGLLIGDGWLASSGLAVDWSVSFRGVGFGVIAAILAGLASAEYYRMCRTKGCRPSLAVMVTWVIVIVFEPFWRQWFPGPMGMSLAAVLFAALLTAGWVQASKYRINDSLVNLSVTIFCVIYIGLGAWFVVMIRCLGAGSDGIWGQIQYLVMFLACVKSTDIGAYFTGRAIGTHKWVPAISPGKSWEGLIGGIFLAMIVASLFAEISDIMNIQSAIGFGLVVAVSGQLGDLLESLLKRDTEIKDSASLVPEFGGFLDLMDSVLVASPFAYVVFLCWSK